MSRAMNLAETPIRTRTTRVPSTAPSASPEMIALAQESFVATKEANAASQRSRAKAKELAKAMIKGGVDVFEFRAVTATGTVAARAAIEPFTVDEIDVNILRNLVDDETFMRVIKAAQGAVKEVCGEHVALKSLVTNERPAELKIKEVK